jgi:gamma-aminobutyric acid type B receptor
MTYCGLKVKNMANYLLRISSILSITQVLLLELCSGGLQSQQQHCPVLHLLNVRPIYPSASDRAIPVWDRGLDISPAGHLAVEEINNRSDILPGYELGLIDVDSEACGVSVISRGVVNVYSELVNHSHCIMGVVGLYCTAVTNIISPIVSHKDIGGYVQIAASTSTLQDRTTPEASENLFHMVGLSNEFNEATLALMHALRWRRISLIHHTADFFHDSIANDFVQRISTHVDFELVARLPIATTELHFEEAFDTITDSEARISYWSVTATESAHLLCEAYNRGLYWPGYVYILREPSIDSILEVQTSCTREQLMIALNGAILLRYRLFADNNTILESRLSYSEYWRMYTKKLEDFGSINNVTLSATTYANTLYDQVWAFGLAIDTLIESHNVSFENYTVESVNKISVLLKSELKNLSFQGASSSGKIQFNGSQKISSYISVFQIQNEIQTLIGIYDPSVGNVTNVNVSDFPEDTFNLEYSLLPVWLGVCILLTQVTLLIMISTNLILTLVWRKKKEIKATSPILSTSMMVGCYFLCLKPIILIIYRMFELSESDTEPLCILEHCMWIGFDLILATLFFKILRIYHIFREHQMTMMSKYWIDRYLFVYVVIVCIGKAFLLIVWYAIDRYHAKIIRVYIKSPVAHYDGTLHCTSDNISVWTVITLLYSCVLLLMSMILAIMTRHNRSIYKDTKKVNFFIFLVVFSLAITVPLWIVYHFNGGRETQSNIVEWLTYFSVPMFCQICLFIPKTLPLVLSEISSRIRRSQNNWRSLPYNN